MNHMTFSELFDPSGLVGQAVYVLLSLSLLTAPMGCFMVWRRLSFFGNTLAHSALLGAILGLLSGLGVLFGVLSFTAILALLLSHLLSHRMLSSDTVLGMMAHLTLALGVVLVSMLGKLRMDLSAYMFGDVLAVSDALFSAMLLLSLLGFVLIVVFWRGFLNLTISPDIAQVEGYRTVWLDRLFILTLALTIALGMLSIGVLLIVALLIIPAAAARLLARSMLMMVFWAWVVTVLSILLGMSAAFYWDFPAGPTVVLTSGVIFLLCYILKPLLGGR